MKFFQGFLALLGITVATSCDDVIGNMICEYGTPTMDYTVMGKVVNLRMEPLEGIKVKPIYPNHSGKLDSTYTDVSGAFTIGQQQTTGFGDYAYLIFEDEGKVYINDTVKIALTKVKDGDGSWYEGEFAAKDVKITMLK